MGIIPKMANNPYNPLLELLGDGLGVGAGAVGDDEGVGTVATGTGATGAWGATGTTVGLKVANPADPTRLAEKVAVVAKVCSFVEERVALSCVPQLQIPSLNWYNAGAVQAGQPTGTVTVK